MNSDTEAAVGDTGASGALIVQATERAIAASLEGVSGILTETASPVADAASASSHSGEVPPTMPSGATLAFTSTASTSTPFKSVSDTAMTTTEDFMAFGQANIEALVKSSQIWAAGVQDLGKHMAASAQAQLDQTMSTWKAMAGVKSVKEALEMHTGLARSAVEAVVSETGKLTDASMKLSEQAFAPITARLSLNVEKFGRVPA